MKNKAKENIPKWFTGTVYEEGGEVSNPFSGDTCLLTAEELSIYDLIKGAELSLTMGMPFEANEVASLMQKGLDWFRKHNPEAYMILLD